MSMSTMLRRQAVLTHLPLTLPNMFYDINERFHKSKSIKGHFQIVVKTCIGMKRASSRLLFAFVIVFNKIIFSNARFNNNFKGLCENGREPCISGDVPTGQRA